jgi:hypothetical protein
MYLTDLISAKDMVRFRTTHPSYEWIVEQDHRLNDIYREYVFLLMAEARRGGWEDQAPDAIKHAMIAISSIDYIISKATEGPTQ